MLYYQDKIFVDLAFPNNMLYNIRLPVLIYVGYRLYNRLFFNQFLQICLLSVLANIVLVPIASVIFLHLMSLISSEDMSFLKSVMLVSVSLFTDPMTILELKPNKNFYLFLGIFILGNSTLLDIFCPVAKLASLGKTEDFYLDCGILVVATLLDIVLGAMLGCLVGILTSLMSRLTRREPTDTYYQSTVVVGGTLVSYFLAAYLTLQPILSVLSCCLVQERYVFNNMDIDTIRAVKDGLKALTHLVQGLFFLYVGYFLANVESAAVWQPVLAVLSVTYMVKAVIMTISLALLNMKKSSLKEMFSALPMLVFGGSRGPRGWAVVMHCQRSYHLPYFSHYVLFTIALSVLLDTFIFKTISQFMDSDDEELEEEEEAELETNGCCKWLASVEKNLFHLLVADHEMTSDDDYDYGVKREMKLQKKLEQHAFPQENKN